MAQGSQTMEIAMVEKPRAMDADSEDNSPFVANGSRGLTIPDFLQQH